MKWTLRILNTYVSTHLIWNSARVHTHECDLRLINFRFLFFSFSRLEPPLLGPSSGGFPPYGPPEFHQSSGDVGSCANAPSGGGGGGRDGGGGGGGGWKPPSGHSTGLMKDPPMPPGGRNGPANFVQQGQGQGTVMMVYGLDNDTSNTDKLFNLVCLYGNVARVNTICTYSSSSSMLISWFLDLDKVLENEGRNRYGTNGRRRGYRTLCATLE